jgi:hypothetical protein
MITKELQSDEPEESDFEFSVEFMFGEIKEEIE